MFGQLVNETTLPVRKRRRPALSCIECRRRKIKCDRNLPCNHCKQTKNSSCVYKDLHPTANRRSPPSGQAIRVLNSTIQNSSQLVINGPYSNDPSYQYQLYDDSSRQTSPVLPSWTEAESASNPSTTATTIDGSLSQVDEQGRNCCKRKEQTFPDAMKITDEEVDGAKWINALGVSLSTFNDVIVQDGSPHAKIRTKFFNQSDLTPIKELRGSMSKTRFFGQSHWMNSFEQFPKICSFQGKGAFDTQDPKTDEANAEIRHLLESCKTTARKLKAERSHQWHMNPDFKDYMPARDISDKLVQHYLRTMESTHRILHIPQFLREYEQYWKTPEKAATASIIKILLVMAIGSCFYQEADSETIRAKAQQWVYSAQAWTSAPFEKGRLNLPGLQIHCLLMLARQTTALGGDLLWIAAGSLLRSAFQMGFHRDPKYFPKISVMHGELRRRLWATVLEITVQTALDSGMPSLITAADFDTEPPSNLDDDDLSEFVDTIPPPKPAHVFTQSSLQIQMLKSIRTRLQISHLLNDFRTEPTYDTVLSLGSSISNTCNETSLLLKSYPPSLPHPSTLQKNLLDMFLRRFLIAIHRPFAVKSTSDPRYYFSRKVCADTALIIMTYPTSSRAFSADGREIMDDFTRLRTVGGGIYKDIIQHAGVLVFLELTLQLEEDKASGLPASEASKAARKPLKDAVDDLADLIARRIELGENNVKGLLFTEATRGYLEALEKGEDLEKGILEAARIAARKCLALLKKRTGEKEAPAEAGTVDGAGVWQGEMLGDLQTGEYEYDFMMQDGSPESSLSAFNFDIPESWLFAGWGDGTGGSSSAL